MRPPKLKYHRKPNTPDGTAPLPAPDMTGRRMREIAGAPQGLEQIRATQLRIELDEAVLRGAKIESPQAHNPSVVVHDGQLLACVRVLSGGVSITKNILGAVSGRGVLEDQREMRDLVRDPAHYPHVRSYGFEDARLFVRGGRLWASATVCDRVPGDLRPKIAVLELDQVGNVVECHVQPSDRLEKNWMPIAGEDELRFVYGLEPAVMVVTYDDRKHLVWPEARQLPNVTGHLRGSSQVLHWKRGYLCVVHQVHAGRPTYVHRFVELDERLQVQRIGRPFFFREEGIEFCAGAAEWGSHLVLSFGVRDREAWLAFVEAEEIARLLS
jgi:hypothetical protein